MKTMSKDQRRVMQWVKFAGRVRFEKVGRRYRITSEMHGQAVMLTLTELNAVKSATGTIALGTM